MLLAQTQSLCPVCLRLVDAGYHLEGDTVYLRKHCPEHGDFQVPAWKQVEGAPAFADWRKNPRIPAYPAHPATAVSHGCPYDCGLCPEHVQHTCTGLLEVTMRCSLGCPVVLRPRGKDFRGSVAGSRRRQMGRAFPRVRALQRSALRRRAHGTRRSSRAHPHGKGKGICARAGQHQRSAPRQGSGIRRITRAAGLDSVYLQFDGLDDAVYRTLRGRDCLALKEAAIEACGAGRARRGAGMHAGARRQRRAGRRSSALRALAGAAMCAACTFSRCRRSGASRGTWETLRASRCRNSWSAWKSKAAAW